MGSDSRLCLLVPLAAAMLAAPAAADPMGVYMKNGTGRAVVVELWSAARRTAWPGDDQVYLLETGERKSVQIECEAGERICYGAWINGDASTFWGIGPERDRECGDCCYVCVDMSTATVDLQP